MSGLKARNAANEMFRAARSIPDDTARSGAERLVAYVDGDDDATAYEVRTVKTSGDEVVLRLRARPKAMTVDALRDRLADILDTREVEVEVDGKRYAVMGAGVAENGSQGETPATLRLEER